MIDGLLCVYTYTYNICECRENLEMYELWIVPLNDWNKYLEF